MALRFRRSVKLGKGLRLNVSKRGVGMSVGTTGLRSSIHSTGSRTKTIGIPGTGLSYMDQTRGGKKKKRSSGTSVSVHNDTTKSAAAVKQYNDYIHAITHLHENAQDPKDWEKMKRTSAPFSPEDTGPREKDAVRQYNQYAPNFFERLFKKLGDNKREELTQAIEEARKQDEVDYRKWQELTAFAAEVLEGNPEAYEQVVKENRNFDDMRERSQLRVLDSETVEMAVQVAPKDVAPKKTLKLTKTGKVSKRKMGKKHYYGIVQDFVCGHALWTARTLFASLPVKTCVIHMTENALNTATGRDERRVLLSVIFDEQTMESLNFARLDPSDAMENFDHRMDFLVTKGFRSVKRISR